MAAAAAAAAAEVTEVAVPRVAAPQLSADEFKLQYMLPNQPVLLTHVPLLHTAAQWVAAAEGEGGRARTDVLRKHFADTTVPVTDVNALYDPPSPCTPGSLQGECSARLAGGRVPTRPAGLPHPWGATS